MQGHVTKAFFFVTKEQLTLRPGEYREEAGAPKYEFSNGVPKFMGHFPDSIASRACGYSGLCSLVRATLAKRGAAHSRATPLELAALIARMGELLKERYHVGFTVLVWNPGDPEMDRVEDALASRRLDVVPARAAIPDLVEKSSGYELNGDAHPNARAFGMLGAYLAQRIGR